MNILISILLQLLIKIFKAVKEELSLTIMLRFTGKKETYLLTPFSAMQTAVTIRWQKIHPVLVLVKMVLTWELLVLVAKQ